jgi:hypothetical protein
MVMVYQCRILLFVFDVSYPRRLNGGRFLETFKVLETIKTLYFTPKKRDLLVFESD